MTYKLSRFLGHLTMYKAMLYLLRVLVAAAIILAFFGVISFSWMHIAGTLLFMVVACWCFNQIFAAIFNTKPNYESQFITAQILTLIAGPVNPLTDYVFLSVLAASAMASKYILAWKKKHIFNPAATAVVVSALTLSQPASWWVGNKYLVIIVLIGGFLVMKKLRWFHLPISFLLTYLILTTIKAGDLSTALAVAQANLIHSALLFFAFVMLPEPLTAPTGKQNRIIYGVGIAAVAFIIQNYTPYPYASYSFELSLLIGNLGVWLTKNKSRIILKFKRKDQVAQNTYSFWFEPLNKVDFIAGQFLEWSVPHNKADSRGTRRWFTIAASPTENEIMLTTKCVPDQMSTFKKALLSLKEGQEISATDADGEFYLPKQKERKYVFIAGGIGVTPFRSIIKNLSDTNERKDIVLMYSNRTPQDIAFKNNWDEAEGKIGLKTIYINSDTDGYINPDMIKNKIPDFMNRYFYVSGPEPMVESFEKMLAGMGIKREKIKRDYFPGYTETHSK